MHECYTRGYLRDEIAVVDFAHDVIYGCIQRTAVAGTEAILKVSGYQNGLEFIYMAKYTPLL